MRTLLIVLLGIIVAFPAEAGKKEKKNRVKSVTSWQTDMEAGKQATWKDTYEEFDKNGNNTLRIEYKKDGKIDRKFTYKYNSTNDKTEEAEYDGTGALKKKTVITYTATGEKATETVTDDHNKVKKHVYSYNAKDLKTERKTYTGGKVQESLKKWQYEYY